MQTYARKCLATLGMIGLMALLGATQVSHARQGDDVRNDNDKEHRGGIPAVLAKLDAIETRIVGNGQRLEELALRMSDMERDVQLIAAVQDDMLPCTPDRFRAGKCNPLGLVATACANLTTEASMQGSFAVAPTMKAELGVGWPEVGWVELGAELNVPLMLAPPPLHIPVVLPSVELAAQAAGGLGFQVCFQGLEIPAGPAADAFTANLVATLETESEGLRAAVQDAMEEADLASPTRIRNALAGLREFRNDTDVTDPLAFFQAGGPLRNLADALPVGTRVTALLDNPDRLIPQGTDLSSICDTLDSRPHFARMAGAICDTLEFLPPAEVVADAFDRITDISNIVDIMQTNLEIVAQAVEAVDITPPFLPPPPRVKCPDWLTPRLCRRLNN